MSVRGYVEWRPTPRSAAILRATLIVLDEYRAELPLTARQIFYRLVETFDYEKSERAYETLLRVIGRARRSYGAGAQGIPFSAVRDGGLSYSIDPHFYDGERAFRETVWRSAESFRLDRQTGQESAIEFWCEAGGMLPILAQAADAYGIKVTTSGGYDSYPNRHELAVRAMQRANDGVRTVVLHVGDFDPSGENMHSVLAEDAETMTEQLVGEEGWLSVERLALTEEQVLAYGVQTAPPKPLDSRSRKFVERHAGLVDALGSEQITAQLEALTPTQLRSLFEDEVEARFERDVYEDVLAEEEPIRASLLDRLSEAGFRP